MTRQLMNIAKEFTVRRQVIANSRGGFATISNDQCRFLATSDQPLTVNMVTEYLETERHDNAQQFGFISIRRQRKS